VDPTAGAGQVMEPERARHELGQDAEKAYHRAAAGLARDERHDREVGRTDRGAETQVKGVRDVGTVRAGVGFPNTPVDVFHGFPTPASPE
jgi:hypothetical protein